MNSDRTALFLDFFRSIRMSTRHKKSKKAAISFKLHSLLLLTRSARFDCLAQPFVVFVLTWTLNQRFWPSLFKLQGQSGRRLWSREAVRRYEGDRGRDWGRPPRAAQARGAGPGPARAGAGDRRHRDQGDTCLHLKRDVPNPTIIWKASAHRRRS
jgi:hypothetical protein